MCKRKSSLKATLTTHLSAYIGFSIHNKLFQNLGLENLPLSIFFLSYRNEDTWCAVKPCSIKNDQLNNTTLSKWWLAVSSFFNIVGVKNLKWKKGYKSVCANRTNCKRKKLHKHTCLSQYIFAEFRPFCSLCKGLFLGELTYRFWFFLLDWVIKIYFWPILDSPLLKERSNKFSV